MSQRPPADRGYAPDDPLAALLAADEVAVPRPEFKRALKSDLLSRPPVPASPSALARLRSLPTAAVGATIIVLFLGTIAGVLLVGDGAWSSRGVDPDERSADKVPTALDVASPDDAENRDAPGNDDDLDQAAPRADQADGEHAPAAAGQQPPADAAGGAEEPAAAAADGEVGSGSGDATGEEPSAGAAGAAPTSAHAPASDPGNAGAGQPASTAEPPRPTAEPEKPRPQHTPTSDKPAATSVPPTDEPTAAPTDEPTEDPGEFPPPPTAAPTGVPWPTETPPAEPPGPSP